MGILKIIFTTEDQKTTRKQIGGFRQSYIIDARSMVLESDYLENQKISSALDFIINKDVERKLCQALMNKKSKQIIYFHYRITRTLVKNIKDFFRSHKVKPKYALYDPLRKYKEVHRMFDQIIK